MHPENITFFQFLYTEINEMGPFHRCSMKSGSSKGTCSERKDNISPLYIFPDNEIMNREVYHEQAGGRSAHPYLVCKNMILKILMRADRLAKKESDGDYKRKYWWNAQFSQVQFPNELFFFTMNIHILILLR